VGEPAIVAAGLRKSYRAGESDVEVLKGLGFTIPRGAFVSIMGPSGSGKSTLLHLVGILDRPTAGTLRLMGRDVGKLTPDAAAEARRDLLGFVFQGFNLMPRLTAQQNVALPMAVAGWPAARRKARAAELLDAVGLGDRLHHRPAQLSGGQKQRVAIARALALDPPILLADEPTGNLDSATSRELMALFGRLHAQGRTIIQVTHDESMARHAQRILRIQDGVLERDEQVHPKAPPAPAPSVPLPGRRLPISGPHPVRRRP
jgi:putative ABC transport system ATP-binding protein